MQLDEDWEFGVLGVDNYRKPGKLRHYFRFIRENHEHVPGDVCEAGVYRGASLLATALLLRELGSEKLVYGFDTFGGFPPVYHEWDEVEAFDRLRDAGRISEEHYEKVQRNRRLVELVGRSADDPDSISTSGDFSETERSLLERKIEFLGLDNVRLVEGEFEETMDGSEGPDRIMAALLDCDLYRSYRVALPFVWERLVRGGYIFLDEYYSLKFPGARIAVDEFFDERDDVPKMHIRERGEFERWYVRKIHGNGE